MQYRDVVIHTNASIFGKEAEMRTSPPVQQRVDLSPEIWIGRLDSGVPKAVMDTCEPRVFGAPPPVRQFAQLYSFVRELPGYADIYRWDHDQELQSLRYLALSIRRSWVLHMPPGLDMNRAT